MISPILSQSIEGRDEVSSTTSLANDADESPNVADPVAAASMEKSNCRRLMPSPETSASDPTEFSLIVDRLGVSLTVGPNANTGRVELENAVPVLKIQKHVKATW